MARPDVFNPGTREAEAGRSGTHEAYLDLCSIVCALFEQVVLPLEAGTVPPFWPLLRYPTTDSQGPGERPFLRKKYCLVLQNRLLRISSNHPTDV